MRVFSSIERSVNLSADDDYWYQSVLRGTPTTAGVEINEFTSLQTAAVYACINVISQDMGSVPTVMYKRSDDGKERAIGHPLYNVLRYQANPEMSAMDFKQTIMGHVLGWGNGYAWIQRARDGKPVGLYPMTPDRVEVYRETDELRRLVYKYTPRIGEVRWFKKEEVLHIHGLGFDGIKGYSVIENIARQSIGLARATENYGASFFANGARPDILFTHPAQMSAEAQKNFLGSWNEKNKGSMSMHKAAILEEGVTATTINIPNSDSQFIEARGFQVPEIARFYRMPLHKIQDMDKSSFDNISQLALEYVNDCLRPWFVQWEQQIWMQLLGRNEKNSYVVEFLAESLLRGDPETRGEFYRELFNLGAITSNQILQRENMNTYDGGDKHYIQLNMASVESGIFDRDEREFGSDGDGNDDENSGNTGNRSTNELILLKTAKNTQELVERVKNQYTGLFLDAFERIISREANLVNRNAKKLWKQGDTHDFMVWAEYSRSNDIELFASQRLEPIIKSIMSVCGDKNVAVNIVAADAAISYSKRSYDLIAETNGWGVDEIKAETSLWIDKRTITESNKIIENICSIIIAN